MMASLTDSIENIKSILKDPGMRIDSWIGGRQAPQPTASPLVIKKFRKKKPLPKGTVS
jgi:hypothetical protein